MNFALIFFIGVTNVFCRLSVEEKQVAQLNDESDAFLQRFLDAAALEQIHVQRVVSRYFLDTRVESLVLILKIGYQNIKLYLDLLKYSPQTIREYKAYVIKFKRLKGLVAKPIFKRLRPALALHNLTQTWANSSEDVNLRLAYSEKAAHNMYALPDADGSIWKFVANMKAVTTEEFDGNVHVVQRFLESLQTDVKVTKSLNYIAEKCLRLIQGEDQNHIVKCLTDWTRDYSKYKYLTEMYKKLKEETVNVITKYHNKRKPDGIVKQILHKKII